MRRFLHLLSKLQWLGLIGFIGIVLDIQGLKYLCFFWLLSLIDVFSTFRSMADSLKLLFQVLGQLIGIPLTYVRYGFHLPNVKDFRPQCRYSLPFSGKWYVVNGGINRTASHSWTVCSQRYAYDFFIVDDTEKSYSGNRENLDSYYCFKQEVLAPADGIVVEIKDCYKDTPIVEEGQADCAASDIRGNYIIIRHGKHEFSLIAHLHQGSICIKPGDIVARGQAIARCGNSGNTSEPHVHFQIQTGKSFLLSAGLPIYFENIEVTGPADKMQNHITKGQYVENLPSQ